MFYVYIHSRADSGLPFYVGKGSGRRLRSTSCRSEYWKRIVAKHGLRADIVARFEIESEAHAHEVTLIAALRVLGFTLANLTDGGEGVSGTKHTDEWKRAMSERKRGVPLSAEHRRKMSEIARARVLTPEHIAKVTAVLTRPKSLEHRAKLRAHMIELNKKSIKRVRCVDTGAEFESSQSAALWLRWQGFSKATNVAIFEGTRGAVRYGYRWEYVN